MKKMFFTKATPRAVQGIRRAYDGTGAKVSAILDPTSGLATVVVEIPEYTHDHVRALAAA